MAPSGSIGTRRGRGDIGDLFEGAVLLCSLSISIVMFVDLCTVGCLSWFVVATARRCPSILLMDNTRTFLWISSVTTESRTTMRNQCVGLVELLEVLQIRDHLSKTPSEKSSDVFCGVENGSIRYPNTLLHGIPQESAKAQRRKSRQATYKLMTPSVSIYLMTNTLLKMPSIHISFLGIHPPKDYARGKGNECLPSALSTYMFDMICSCFSHTAITLG